MATVLVNDGDTPHCWRHAASDSVPLAIKSVPPRPVTPVFPTRPSTRPPWLFSTSGSRIWTVCRSSINYGDGPKHP